MNWDNSTDKNIANNGEGKTTPKTKSLKCVPEIGKWVCKKKDNSNERNLSLCRRVQSFQLPWRRLSKLLPVIKQRSLWWERGFVKSLYVENYDSKNNKIKRMIEKERNTKITESGSIFTKLGVFPPKWLLTFLKMLLTKSQLTYFCSISLSAYQFSFLTKRKN